MKAKKDDLTDWLAIAFKSMIFVLFTVFTFFVNQLNGSIASLTAQLKVMEFHQIETDKRVLAIEVSREGAVRQYEKLISDVSELKTSVTQLTMRTQTIADFIVKKIQ